MSLPVVPHSWIMACSLSVMAARRVKSTGLSRTGRLFHYNQCLLSFYHWCNAIIATLPRWSHFVYQAVNTPLARGPDQRASGQARGTLQAVYREGEETVLLCRTILFEITSVVFFFSFTLSILVIHINIDLYCSHQCRYITKGCFRSLDLSKLSCWTLTFCHTKFAAGEQGGAMAGTYWCPATRTTSVG